MEKIDCKLFGNPICPYSQRAEIALIEAAIEYEFVVIDFCRKPDWFMDVSPLKKIPVLKHGDFILFESVAIVEYLNEIADGFFLPEKPKDRGCMRSLCGYIEHLHQCARNYFSGNDEQSLIESGEHLANELSRLVNELMPEGYSGKRIDMLGVHLIPLFILIDFLDERGPVSLLTNIDLQKIKNSLLQRASARLINNERYQSQMEQFIAGMNSAFSNTLKIA